MKAIILSAAIGCFLGAVACGSSSSQDCQTATCPTPSTKTYQVCATAGNTVTTENYNGTSCQIDTANSSSSSSQACASAIATYCSS